jgi:hypothetical protein
MVWIVGALCLIHFGAGIGVIGFPRNHDPPSNQVHASPLVATQEPDLRYAVTADFFNGLLV